MNYDRFVEMMDQVPEKIRWAAITGVVIALVLVYYILLRLPAEDRLKMLNKNHAVLQQDFNEKLAIANDLKDWEAQVQKLASQFQEALSQLPEKVGYDTLIIAVPNIAKKNGLNLVSFDMLAERPQQDYNEVPIQMRLDGPYKGLGRFIQEIGEHPRIMKIGDFDVKVIKAAKDKKGDAAGSVSISAELITYRFSAHSPVPTQPGGKK